MIGHDRGTTLRRRWTVTRTRAARTRVLLVPVLAVAAVACGGAAAAMPALSVRVHARLAPLAGARANGNFNGALAMGSRPSGVLPRNGYRWELTWKLRLTARARTAAASLQIRAHSGAAPLALVLCSRCVSSANGTLSVTSRQAMRIANGDAVVVVQARSTRLRGVVKAEARLPRG
jgi:hypothetical protein